MKGSHHQMRTTSKYDMYFALLVMQTQHIRVRMRYSYVTSSCLRCSLQGSSFSQGNGAKGGRPQGSSIRLVQVKLSPRGTRSPRSSSCNNFVHNHSCVEFDLFVQGKQRYRLCRVLILDVCLELWIPLFIVTQIDRISNVAFVRLL